MRKLATVAALVTLGLVAVPSSASAKTCLPDGNQEVCVALNECYLVGTVIFFSTTPAEAVTWSRNCLFLDRRYRLDTHSAGGHAHERARRLRVVRSDFWGVYCEAERRAGNPDAPLCLLKSAPGRGGGGGGGGDRGGDRGTRDPRFTGRIVFGGRRR